MLPIFLKASVRFGRKTAQTKKTINEGKNEQQPLAKNISNSDSNRFNTFVLRLFAVLFLQQYCSSKPFPIREIQTDNGAEFTNAFLKKNSTHQSLFEELLEKCNIKYHRIRVATPRHNGKVERQHRIDESRFYKKMTMYNLSDGRKQLAKYNKKSNNIPKTCLNFKTPNEVLQAYLGVM